METAATHSIISYFILADLYVLITVFLIFITERNREGFLLNLLGLNLPMVIMALFLAIIEEKMWAIVIFHTGVFIFIWFIVGGINARTRWRELYWKSLENEGIVLNPENIDNKMILMEHSAAKRRKRLPLFFISAVIVGVLYYLATHYGLM